MAVRLAARSNFIKSLPFAREVSFEQVIRLLEIEDREERIKI